MIESLEGRTLMSASLMGSAEYFAAPGRATYQMTDVLVSGVSAPQSPPQGIIAVLIAR
jgi:hypothetical protein